MKRAIASLSLVAVVGLLAAVWFFSADERRGGVLPAQGEAEPERQVEAKESPVLAAAQGVEEAPRVPERVALEEGVPAERAGAVEASTAARTRMVARVRGRCVDGAARPLAEVEISGPGVAEGPRSAADGSFELEADLSGQMSQTASLRFALAGLGTCHVQSLLRAGESSDLGDVVLLLAGRVSGRVVDAQGLALGGAHVRIEEALDLTSGSRFTGPEDTLVAGESAANGRFLLEGVPPGALRVWAGQEEWLWSATERLELAPGGELADLELELAPLEPEDTIRLLVLDPAGAPVPRAKILYLYELPGHSGSGDTQADEHGRYTQFLELRASYSFQACDPEERYCPAVAYDAAPGTHDLVLQLGEKRSFRLRVEDETGAPVAKFQARAEQARGRFHASHEPPEHGPAGEVEIVVPPATFELVVEAEGFELEKLGPFEPALVPRTLVARLESLPGVRGRVTTADGPLAGARVGLHEAEGGNGSYTVNGFPCFMERFPRAETLTDEDGEYVLSLRESDDWYVRASAPGFAPAELGPLRIEAGIGARGLDLVLGRGGAIAGRVLVPAGEEPSGHIVGLSRGDGHGFTGRTDAAGEYSFEGLTPGNWQVAWRKGEISTNSTSTSSSSGQEPQRIPWDCVVHEDRTTRFDLDLRALQLATLSGRFLLGGKAPPDWIVSLSSGDEPGPAREAASLDSDGRFRLTTDKAGAFELVFNGFATSIVRASARVVLAPGENSWEADVPVGGLRGRIRPGLLEPDARLELVSEAYPGLVFRAVLVRGPDDSLRSQAVPAGPARIEYTNSSGQKLTKEIDVPESRALEIELP